MGGMFKWCIWWLACVPFIAHADPVAIHATASGSLPTYSIWIYQFAGADVPSGSDPLPFSLVVATGMDADAPYYSEPVDLPWRMSQQYRVPASISLTIDGQTYNFSGTSSVEAAVQPGTFRLRTMFHNSYYIFDLSLIFSNPESDLSGHPLSPRTLRTADGFAASYWLSSTPYSQDAPGQWDAIGTFSSATLSVSPVPEPGNASMLLAGLMTLLVVARRKWGQTPFQAKMRSTTSALG